MQRLILKAYAKEMLHLGLFQPLGKQTIPCVIVTVAGSGHGSIRALKVFFSFMSPNRSFNN